MRRTIKTLIWFRRLYGRASFLSRLHLNTLYLLGLLDDFECWLVAFECCRCRLRSDVKSQPMLIEIEREGTNTEFVSGSLSKARRKKALTLNKVSNFMHHLSLVLQFFLFFVRLFVFRLAITAQQPKKTEADVWNGRIIQRDRSWVNFNYNSYLCRREKSVE